MATFEDNLQKYAELAVKVGVNVQKGQTLIVNAPITAAEFVRKVTKIAYEVGAKNVLVEWHDDEITKTKYHLAPDEAFEEFPMWRAKGLEEMAENGASIMSVVSTNPDLLKGVDPKRISTWRRVAGKAMEKYSKYVMADKVSWNVIAVPSQEWAAKVFPDVNEEEQVDKLWDAIFKATRADLENPLQAWDEHNDTLHSKRAFLNEKKFKKLHYKAPGTDLTIELPEGHIWAGGSHENQDGVVFNANIPTEEVYTLPLKTGVNGTVSSTKPLNYGGNLIDNFSLTFENGRIVDFTAEEGLETLKHLVETDEGSHYLGEVALVPHNSPISNTNILFYNTLFDENASNHLAIGAAYTTSIKGGTKMSKEELEEHGVNDSLTHVDFMIGSAEMDIDGLLEDGTVVPLFRKGNWAL
jgi:aminopeptidase